MAQEIQPTAEGGPDALRSQALLEAAMIMFPGLLFDHVTDSLGSPEYTQRRMDALTTIRNWLNTEFAWMEHEAVRDQPCEVRYASASDREGAVRRVVPSEEEARAVARRAGPTASFGYYIAKQARRPLEP